MKSLQPKLVLALTALSVVLSGLFVAGEAQRVDAQAAGGTAPITLRIGTVAPEGTPWEKQMKNLRSHIERETQGRVKVRVFMGGSLGGEKALVRRVSQGTLECFAGSTAALGSVVEELNVIETPYLFDDAAAADRALDGPALPIVRTALSEHGFTFGIWAENGFRSWFTRERPIRTPADLRGLRMRSQEASVHLDTYRAFGASPNPIDVTNVLTSLQTGAVDGFDNTPLFAFATSWYQAARHLNLSQHSYQPGIVVYSTQWLNAQPAEIQQVLTNLPASITADGRQGVRRMDPILIQNLERAGITVHRPTPAERQQFAAIGRPLQDRVAGSSGSHGQELLRALRGR
ncbi:MAG: TRAP transporter substrate-binding protein [Deltaproteobacteria bacterium]|jgi:tripartite ATP-independent transporter DctP family solute receptor